MTKKIISTDRAPAAAGPYSQAVIAGGMVYVSGQLPINPETGDIVSGSAKDKIRQTLNNIMEVLKASGSSPDKVVKVTVYLTDMNDFPAVNEVFSGFFPENPPARVCVEVSRIPKDVSAEIDAIAVL